MKNLISRVVSVGLVALAFISVASAQQNDAVRSAAGDKYVISAKAGGVNFVEGTVAVIRKSGRSGLLLKGDTLEIGDRVSTGADGKAEILLNPGSYLRLGGLSAFEFRSTSLDDLQIRLDSGSAIFEVFATEDFRVTVNSPKTKLALIDSGIYRIDVAADGTGKVAVWKGRAEIGNEATVVKSGREATLAGSQASIVKFDRDDRDQLEVWSKGRAKELAKISSSLAKNTMRTALMRSYLGRGWNMYGSFGLWVFDPFTSYHCFLPFGYGWYSPYGYGFGHSIWYYNLPPVVYSPPSGGGSTGGGPRVVHDVKTPRIAPPPFIQAQGSSGSTGRQISTIKPGRGDSDGGDPVRSSGSVYVPPMETTRTISPTKGNH